MKSQVEILSVRKSVVLDSDFITLRTKIQGGIVNILLHIGMGDTAEIKTAWRESDDNKKYVVKGDVVIPSEVEYNGKVYPVTRISGWCFNGQDKITSVYIPDSVTSIGSYAFYQCFNLNKVRLPKHLEHINEGVFDSTALTEIELPSTILTINKGAFHSCDELERINVPSSVVFIDKWAFGKCKSLKDITVPINAIIDEEAFSYSPTQIAFV